VLLLGCFITWVFIIRRRSCYIPTVGPVLKQLNTAGQCWQVCSQTTRQRPAWFSPVAHLASSADSNITPPSATTVSHSGHTSINLTWCTLILQISHSLDSHSISFITPPYEVLYEQIAASSGNTNSQEVKVWCYICLKPVWDVYPQSQIERRLYKRDVDLWFASTKLICLEADSIRIHSLVAIMGLYTAYIYCHVHYTEIMSTQAYFKISLRKMRILWKAENVVS
jgi:hypothetical protein